MGKLFIVPTPIGNLEDITLRAIRVLKEADLVLSEDTRQTGKLLKHYDIDTPQRSFHQHNEHKILSVAIDQIKTHNSVALVSDAGTPGISDPGFLLVRECISNNIEVECLPGATALIPALVESGFPCDNFYFIGFLPVKKGRKKRLDEIKLMDKTVVLYESPHKIQKTIRELKEILEGNRRICISREISKIHHETMRGTLNEIDTIVQSRKLKGEIVIAIAGS